MVRWYLQSFVLIAGNMELWIMVVYAIETVITHALSNTNTWLHKYQNMDIFWLFWLSF